MDFLQELKKLVYSKPRNRIHARNNQNSPYVDYVANAKNAYLCFHGSDIKDSYYCEHLYNSNDCVDCDSVANAELCYECVDCADLYDCTYLQDCYKCAQCYFCFDMVNCKNCFGSFGLRNAEYFIFNVKHSHQEYEAKIKALRTQPPLKVFEEVFPYFEKHVRPHSRLYKADNKCLGDYIYSSKNCFHCYNVSDTVDCGYLYDAQNTGHPLTETYDCSFCGGLENSYSCYNTTFSKDSNFLLNCAFMESSEYCMDCYRSKNCFGCVHLEGKEYHILNRPFPRAEYVITLQQIKDMLKSAGQYGKTWDQILG